jgi:hypothetical protein
MILVIITILIGNPSVYYTTGNVLRYFIIGTTFNLIRITAVGITIGYVWKRQNMRINQEVCK